MLADAAIYTECTVCISFFRFSFIVKSKLDAAKCLVHFIGRAFRIIRIIETFHLGNLQRIALKLTGVPFCYVFKDILPFGLAALFLFNMSMPLTLYLLAKRMPGMPGLAFGLLTFALYLGFVLIYTSPVSVPLIGPLGSLVSAVLLAYAAGESDAG